MKKTLATVAFAAFAAACGEVVQFKDAAKIKSWDAWNDKAPPAANAPAKPFKERRSVTWEKLNKLDPGLKEIGRLAVRGAGEIKASPWSVGCETLDRDYADWNAYKNLLAPLGAKRARFFSGWAKTEQEKGKYDFAWLDAQVRETAAMGVKPWICLSYGNPIYGSDFRLGMKVRQVTDSEEAFAAWLRYCTACVERYKDVVDEWEIWNEPFGQGKEYAELFYRTAKAIRAVQPGAKCWCTAISFPKDYKTVLEKLKSENALDLASRFIYHPYSANPDASYWKLALPLRKLVKSYSGAFDIMQGEVGCPAQLEFAHALNGIEWTEYSQAKWLLRRTIGDAARSIPSSVFTMIDLQYTFMLQSFGLVRSDTLKEAVYRRPSYYAMQNVFGYLDGETRPARIDEDCPFKIESSFDPRDSANRRLTVARFTRFGRAVRFAWFADSVPSATLGFDRISVSFPGELHDPVWVEMITGRVFEIPAENVRREKGWTRINDLPVWDSPVMVADRVCVPLRIDWKKMSPREIVDSFYRPGQGGAMKALPPPGSQPWMDMKTEDFLPCIDRYGQFKHREWPGKTHGDADLKKAAEEEEKDLAANPGPGGWNKYGGWANGPQLEATGRFRAQKLDGKWWLVDPDGRLYWSFGVMRVTPSSAMTPMDGDNCSPRRGCSVPARDCFFEELPPEPGAKGANVFSKFWTTRDELLWRFYEDRGEKRVYDLSSANLYRKYGEDYYAKFADLAHRRLRSWGLNAMSSSSDRAICLMDKTPYAERVEGRSRYIAGSHGNWFKFRDPWDVSFKKGVTDVLAERGRQAHDPWCIGFFVDNEINWGATPRQLAEWTVASPEDQPAKVEFARILRAKYGEIAKLNAAWKTAYADWDDFLHTKTVPGGGADADLAAFTRTVADEYFRRTREAIKEFDPGLMYLGCRFAGGARKWAIEPCAKYCDVVSYNLYRENLDGWKLPDGIDKPVIVPEFHFGATDRGPFGTGVRQAASQEDRARKIKSYVRSALANPQIVGIHWHQFSDQATTGRFDGEYLQVGFTDVCDTPYPETVTALREAGYGIYEARSRPGAQRVKIACAYPGGNVKVRSIDETNGIVEISPDMRDTKGKWFYFDFTVSGAAGRTLHFRFPKGGYPYLSTLGPAISRDGGATWRWLHADGSRHMPPNAFDYTFADGENETRFAFCIPYTQKDWDAALPRWLAKGGVETGVLCKSQSGRRDTELLRIPCRKGNAKLLVVFTARHHACEASASPVMEGIIDEILSGSPEGDWLRDNADIVFVPFVDKDGVEDGDQGKNRAPHDHNRDYVAGRYTSVRALKKLITEEAAGRKFISFDLHSPFSRSFPPREPEQEAAFVFQYGEKVQGARIDAFRRNWAETAKDGALVYHGKFDIKPDVGHAAVMERDRKRGLMSFRQWTRVLPECYMSVCCEFGYSLCGGVYSKEGARELGANLLKALSKTAATEP